MGESVHFFRVEWQLDKNLSNARQTQVAEERDRVVNPQGEHLEEVEGDFVEGEVSWCCAAAKDKDLLQSMGIRKQCED